MAKKKTPESSAPESSATDSPAKKTPRKPAAGKSKKAAPAPAASPMVDTDAAARLAAMMIGNKVELPPAGTSGKPSATIQRLKSPPVLPGLTSTTTQSILGNKRPTGHASNQQGHNQTLGHDTRNVPRRTPG